MCRAGEVYPRDWSSIHAGHSPEKTFEALDDPLDRDDSLRWGYCRNVGVPRGTLPYLRIHLILIPAVTIKLEEEMTRAR